ncbi:MAG: alcohol dehydrogenase catalytic domain-containing protein [Chloroflexia bacterium]|nr:alcohol dehydrogenase catalytic domain-containing protein [Chloroflexia bacterium]
MDQQSGYRIHEWGGDLHWDSFPRPEPGEGEVLLRVEARGIGLTVLRYLAGNLSTDAADLPRVPGHEIAGIVAAVGPGVDARSIGQTCRRVLLPVLSPATNASPETKRGVRTSAGGSTPISTMVTRRGACCPLAT